MMNGRINSYEPSKSFGQRLLGTLIFVAIIGVCLYLFYQIYKLLFLLSPIFIIAALVMHPKVVGNHIRMIGQSFQQNFVGGLLELMIQLIGLPIVTIGLVVKAWAYRKFGQYREGQVQVESFEERYAHYEEVTSTPVINAHNAAPQEKNTVRESVNYDDLFE
ncbi:MAG: hypothetical protein U0T81_05500 [Saprospiraceae bacterium]